MLEWDTGNLNKKKSQREEGDSDAEFKNYFSHGDAYNRRE